MGVIDERVRQKRVQQNLDRRIGRRGRDEARALNAHDIFVAERRPRPELAQTVEPHGGKIGRLDIGHVGTRAFDAQHRDLVAERVSHARLERGIAAAVQHELGIAAEQARRIDAQREIAADASAGIAVDRRLRFAVDPGGFHLPVPSGARAKQTEHAVSSCRGHACSTSQNAAGDRQFRSPPNSTPPAR